MMSIVSAPFVSVVSGFMLPSGSLKGPSGQKRGRARGRGGGSNQVHGARESHIGPKLSFHYHFLLYIIRFGSEMKVFRGYCFQGGRRFAPWKGFWKKILAGEAWRALPGRLFFLSFFQGAKRRPKKVPFSRKLLYIADCADLILFNLHELSNAERPS